MVGLFGAGVAAVASTLFENSEISGDHSQIVQLQRKTDSLEAKVRHLSYNTASGGGVNLKMMPHPVSGEAAVPLEEVFSFDRNHAMCRVDTNPQAFKMETFSSGEVVVPANQFFMAMVVTTIDQFQVSTAADRKAHVTMRGGLSCRTEVGLTTVRFGSRTAAEHATYEIEAVDAGVGGGAAGDSFAFTVFFDPNQAAVNHAIFGPKFTFTGKMIEGEVTIIDPNET
ncbi:MAG TPA: hypothetical protein VJQ08_00810 [Candidatus Dormibacteraeota bacterium]|nr:hypothetical protein [Candidatus Dormibacteraeota bacterium]